MMRYEATVEIQLSREEGEALIELILEIALAHDLSSYRTLR